MEGFRGFLRYIYVRENMADLGFILSVPFFLSGFHLYSVILMEVIRE
jgi:hypothetical protein